jgi:hypothetical protein
MKIDGIGESDVRARASQGVTTVTNAKKQGTLIERSLDANQKQDGGRIFEVNFGADTRRRPQIAADIRWCWGLGWGCALASPTQ